MGAMKIIGELNYNKNILQEDFMIAAFQVMKLKYLIIIELLKI